MTQTFTSKLCRRGFPLRGRVTMSCIFMSDALHRRREKRSRHIAGFCDMWTYGLHGPKSQVVLTALGLLPASAYCQAHATPQCPEMLAG